MYKKGYNIMLFEYFIFFNHNFRHSRTEELRLLYIVFCGPNHRPLAPVVDDLPEWGILWILGVL